MQTFSYTSKSKTLFYNGHVFDSTLELKYILMIEETHSWLRNGLEIYYNIDEIENGIKDDLRCYRPDFLTRNWLTGDAHLIEIKPDGYNHESAITRKKIARQHIENFQYDWTYKIVTESEIKLTSEQWLQYEKILASQDDWTHKPCGKLLQNRSNLSDIDYQHFVFTGFLPAAFP